MTDFTRRRAMAVLGAATLAGCAETGTGTGTDIDIAGGKKTPKGGIGGTGIVGTITDLGSVILNGRRVETPAGLVATTALGEIAIAALGIGDQVTIEAETGAAGLIARRIHLAHPAIGRLSGAPGGLLQVSGALIQPEPNAVLSARPGDMVAVSGVWRGDRVIASKIAPIAASAGALSGTLRPGTAGGWTIGGVPVTLPSGALAEADGFATVTGRSANGAFRAETLAMGRFTGAAGPLVALSVEGYLAPTSTAPFHTVDGLGHSFAPETDLLPYLRQRTLFQGTYDGTFVLDEGLALAEDLTERRTQLRP